jgi:hypothetical protein
MGMLLCVGIGVLLIALPTIIGMWKIFEKAGQPGWACIIPIYNYMIMARIAGKDDIWGLLVLIPIVGIYFAIVLVIEMCARFDKEVGYAIGMILLPFIFAPMLGFSDAEYRPLGGARRRRRVFDEDDYDDRPRRRSQRIVAEDEDRPRRSRRAMEEAEDEDRPRRKRPPDDDDRIRRKRPRGDAD